MQMVVCIAYFAVLLLSAMYGLHRSHLVFTVLRHRKTTFSTPTVAECDFPHVTVQLPLFNEVTVARRLLDYVAALDYPRDRLEIQVLDDSTDETVSIVRAHVGRLALQLLGHRRHVAPLRHRGRGRLAARHAHRGSRSQLPRPAPRLEVHLPRERGDAGRAPRGSQRVPRSAVPVGQGNRA